MEKLLVVVLDDETKAMEGSRLLWELDSDGEISVHEVQILTKEAGGPVHVIDDTEHMTFPAVAGGTAVGALIGLLGGPAGVIFGATAGATIGVIGSAWEEAAELGLTEEFVNDVTAALTPGKFAVVADISEEQMTPLDTKMEQAGGVVFRRTRSQVKTTQEDRDAASHRAEMEQLKVERAKAKSGRLAKIDARIDHLRKKLEAALERKRVKMQLRQQQREARIRALQTKADQAQGEVRRRRESRIDELRRDYAERAAAG